MDARTPSGTHTTAACGQHREGLAPRAPDRHRALPRPRPRRPAPARRRAPCPPASGRAPAAAQRSPNKPSTPLTAIPRRRVETRHESWPRREAEFNRNSTLSIRQPRGAVIAHQRKRVNTPAARGPEQFLRATTSLIKVDFNHDLLHGAWCSQPTRPSRSRASIGALTSWATGLRPYPRAGRAHPGALHEL